jgi:hypothetical protein
MIKQSIVCENAKVQGLDVQERYVQVQDEFVKGIWVYSETSSSMTCIPQPVNLTSKNVRFTPSQVLWV